jgi:putative ABC transport system permease protein
MIWYRRLVRRLRVLFAKERIEGEMRKELQFHLETEFEANLRAGMSPEEARRVAMLAFGGVERIKERARDTRGGRRIDDLLRDIRFAHRRLRRDPGFSVAAVLTLALGIGATVASFSIVNGVLIKPLPYPNPGGLVAVLQTAPGIGIEEMGMCSGQYFTYRAENRTFEDLGLTFRAWVTVTGQAEPEQVLTLGVSEATLPLLGVQPALGRLFTAEDDSPVAPPTVILGHWYWLRRFGGNPDVIGSLLTLNGMPTEVVGILPEQFSYLDMRPGLIVPLQLDPARATIGGFGFRPVARLRPGMTIQEANADLARMLPLAIERFPTGATQAQVEEWQLSPLVTPLKDHLVGSLGSRLWLLLGAVGIVFVIACTNVANLFLVRTEGRQREIAVRAALGAGRRRVAWELLLESLILGVSAGTLGLGIAWGGIRLLRLMAPATVPRLEEIGLDPNVLLFTLSVSVLGGLFLGLFPVAKCGDPRLIGSLSHGTHGMGRSDRRVHARSGLAVAQLALAMVLLISSGLMVRSLHALRKVHPGFERPEELLTFTLNVPNPAGADLQAASQAHEQILRAIKQIPGILSVGASSSVPMDGRDYENTVDVEDRPNGTFPTRRNNFVSEGYFETMEIPVLAGRPIEWADVREGRRVAVVSESFAKVHWGDPAAALGRNISQNAAGGEGWREIVGVVGDVHSLGLDREPWPTVYWPMAVANFWGSPVFIPGTMVFSVRVGGVGPMQILDRVREAVWSVNPDLPLAAIRTQAEILDRSAARTSFTMVLLSISATLAMAFGIVGLYGVISYSVSSRNAELGLRVAMGAQRGDVTKMVLGQGFALAAVGVAVGLAGAAGLTRLMAALLFGVSPADPTTYGVVSITLTAVALLASFIPAHRAASLDPLIALRHN